MCSFKIALVRNSMSFPPNTWRRAAHQSCPLCFRGTTAFLTQMPSACKELHQQRFSANFYWRAVSNTWKDQVDDAFPRSPTKKACLLTLFPLVLFLFPLRHIWDAHSGREQYLNKSQIFFLTESLISVRNKRSWLGLQQHTSERALKTEASCVTA